jgi:uncharacterized protein YrrD
VQDLYLDSSFETVLGLYLGSQGLVRRKSELIRAGDIVVLGADAVLVKNGNVLTDDNALPAAKGWVRRDKLSGREADTPGGTRLGVIGDVIVDQVGAITGFALSKAYVEGPLAEKRVISRSVVLDTGQEDGRMTVDLAKLEASLLNAEAVPLAVESLEDIPVTKIEAEDLPDGDPPRE